MLKRISWMVIFIFLDFWIIMLNLKKTVTEWEAGVKVSRLSKGLIPLDKLFAVTEFRYNEFKDDKFGIGLGLKYKF